MIESRKILRGIAPYEESSSTRYDKIRLDLNENVMGCSPKVLEAIRNVGAWEVATYPEYRALREKIASYHKMRPESIMLANGGDDTIRCIMEAYLEKGDKIIIPVPTFPMFKAFAELREGKVEEVEYGNDLSFPFERVMKAVEKKPRMLVMVNPNNPTGTSLEEKNLIRIVKKAKDTVVLLDETYYHFKGITHVKLTKRYRNLIILQSFSKVFGLAGLRLGYVVSARENIENMRKVNLPFCVNSLAVIAGKVALEDRRHASNALRKIEREKAFLFKEITELGADVRMTDTNFLLLNFGKSCPRICTVLARRGLLIKCLNVYPLLEGYARVSISSHDENVKFLEVMREVLSKKEKRQNMSNWWRH